MRLALEDRCVSEEREGRDWGGKRAGWFPVAAARKR